MKILLFSLAAFSLSFASCATTSSGGGCSSCVKKAADCASCPKP